MFTYSEFVHHYTRSKMPHVEPISRDYTVSVNGTPVPVYTARISKFPFNREWPGYQRSIDQTELVSFVHLVSDEPLALTVTTTRSHERVRIKPYSKKITPVEKEGKITFTLPENGQFVLECDSYHGCLYIFNSLPIEAPDPASVTHYFGPGVHFPGKLTLHSHESVYVDRDALVFGCLYAEDAEDIHIFGNGLFDDAGEGRMNGPCYEAFTNGNLKFYDCRNIRIEGILLRDSAIWCINLFHCFDVTVDEVKVFGQWRYNTDGVDIVNCQNITIRNSFIHSFDDTVTIKGIDRYATTDNAHILTENCVLWCDWGKTCEIGIETACREYRDIIFRNCDILRAGNTALDIQNGDCAAVSDILFEDIRVEYNAFDTDARYQSSDEQVYDGEGTIQTPALVSIMNFRFRSPGMLAAWGAPSDYVDLTGIEQATVRNVTCRNIRVYFDEAIPLAEDGRYPISIIIRPSVEGARFANIRLEDLSINGKTLIPDRTLLTVGDVDGFSWSVWSRFRSREDHTPC